MVATSKKNACVSLVFSFLYKVVQVSRAPRATEGLLTRLCSVPPHLGHPRATASLGGLEPQEEDPRGGCHGLICPSAW